MRLYGQTLGDFGIYCGMELSNGELSELRKAAGQRLLPGCYLALWALAGARFLLPVNISPAAV